MGLGDRVEQALRLVGVTPERVSRWLGRECGCEDRKQKLNQLGAWVARIFSGKNKLDSTRKAIEDVILIESNQPQN